METFNTKYIKKFEKVNNSYIYKGEIKGTDKIGDIKAITGERVFETEAGKEVVKYYQLNN